MGSIADLIGRSRTIATQMAIDANQSVVIDNDAGLRALLNNVIRDLWVKKANDKKNFHDITTRHTVAVTASVGAIPTLIMRELLLQAQFQDTADSLIAYFPYPVDYLSGVTFTQLGYVTIQGDNFLYRAPAPNQSYTGDLYVTAPTFPTLPSSWSSTLSMSEDAYEDTIMALALAIRGEYKFLDV